MKQKPNLARTALAASVAVIALSSTPLTAQTAPQPVQPPVVAPAPAASPAIPEPSFSPAPTTAPTTATQPAPAPVIRVPDVDATAQREPAAQTRTAATGRSTPARTGRAAEPQPAAVASAADSAEPALPAEAAPALSKTDIAKQELATKVDGATIAPSGEIQGFGAGEEGWLAALAALLGLGVVGGGAYAAMRRRRRPVADEEIEVAPEELVVEPSRPAPAFAATPRRQPARPVQPAMAAASGPVSEIKVEPVHGSLIDQIDFGQQPGYYEAQIDQRPTPINPFLTYRKRLTRARFLDRQLRLARERRGETRTFRPRARPPVRERVLEPA